MQFVASTVCNVATLDIDIVKNAQNEQNSKTFQKDPKGTKI